jgi:hypothetical protein
MQGYRVIRLVLPTLWSPSSTIFVRLGGEEEKSAVTGVEGWSMVGRRRMSGEGQSNPNQLSNQNDDPRVRPAAAVACFLPFTSILLHNPQAASCLNCPHLECNFMLAISGLLALALKMRKLFTVRNSVPQHSKKFSFSTKFNGFIFA